MSNKKLNKDIETDRPISMKSSIEKKTCFNFHPEIIIDDYFQSIINKIDINTETLLMDQTLTKAKSDILLNLREKQIKILEEIKRESLMSLKYDEDKYLNEWGHVIKDETLSFKQKVEIVCQKLLSKCCILNKDNRVPSGQSLWILPASFCDKNKRKIFK
jgi:hypothetical protein